MSQWHPVTCKPALGRARCGSPHAHPFHRTNQKGSLSLELVYPQSRKSQALISSSETLFVLRDMAFFLLLPPLKAVTPLFLALLKESCWSSHDSAREVSDRVVPAGRRRLGKQRHASQKHVSKNAQKDAGQGLNGPYQLHTHQHTDPAKGSQIPKALPSK